jgi:hypothetical protein
MSRRVFNNWPVIHLISTDLTKEQYKNIIKELSTNQVLAIVEICINIFYGNIPLTDIQRSTLQPHKKVLNYLSEETHTLKQKQQYIGRNITPIKEIICVAETYINSLKKSEDEQNRETSTSTMGEIYTTHKE